MLDAMMRDRGLLRIARWTIDVVVLLAAFASSFLYRFAWPLPMERVEQLQVMVGPVLAFSLVALVLTGGHRHSWRYTSLRDVFDVILATTLTAAVLLALRFAPATPEPVTVSVGVILAYWVTATVGLCGVRMLRRLQSERAEARSRRTGSAVEPVLLIGAGRAGVMVAAELVKRPDLGLRAVGFIDDDSSKRGRRVAGLDVLGSTDDLAEVARVHGVTEAVITMASVARRDIGRIVDACRAAGLEPKIIPGLFEIVGGTVDLATIRPVQVEDLLGRDPVELDETALHALLDGKVVLVSGAGGSIGAELARQVARFGPAQLVLLERSEPALWAIERELTRAHPDLDVHACIGDVTDPVRMRRVFNCFPPHVVLHAAAYKHVPMMETHPGEAVKNNLGGTKVVADLAAEFGVEQFVLVSTDKEVNPTSIMGATKRLASRYVMELARRTGVNFVAVRFGNVLGSTGSVVPIFEEQVRTGGPVTVTHPDMVRYFMTIPEASGLVLQAATLGRPGDVLILDMGEPVRIADLAENVIRLSGFEPGVDVDIEFTGLRPGEKLYEELTRDHEVVEATTHPKIAVSRHTTPAWEDLEEDVRVLLAAADQTTPEDLRRIIQAMVPEFVHVDDRAVSTETLLLDAAEETHQ